jgi:hypothetical protein
MGIRFYCPNGHKMNVKEFQAGLTGLCPNCGVKVQIPLTSTRPSTRHREGESPQSSPKAVAAGSAAASPVAPVTPEWLAAAISPAESAQQAGSAAGNSTANSYASAPVTFSAAPSAPAASAAPAAAVDPLTAAGNVVWYVRPPSGGQFGPASTDVMRSWLAEGRVSPDTLVWHEGWRDWQDAAAVFPQLSPGQSITALEAIVEEPIVSPVYTHPPKPHVPPKSTQLMALGGLAVAVVILLIIFFAVWMTR